MGTKWILYSFLTHLFGSSFDVEQKGRAKPVQGIETVLGGHGFYDRRTTENSPNGLKWI